eukprot:549669-Prorocentrum_minimum.AAC.4
MCFILQQIAAAITGGCTMFALGGEITSKHAKKSADTTYFGVALMLGYLGFDGFTSTFQDKLFKGYKMETYNQANCVVCLGTHQMLYVNLCSASISLFGLLTSGQLFEAIEFVGEHPDSLMDIIFLSICATVGQLIILYTIKEFGALLFATIMTTPPDSLLPGFHMALHSLCANKRPRSRSQQGCCGSLSGDFPPLEYPPFLHHLRPSAELHAVGSYLPDLWRFVHGGMSHQSTVITLVVVVEVVVAALTENLPTALVESTQGENIGGTASRSNENRRSTLYFYQLRHVLQGLKGEASRCSGLCSEEAFSKGPAKEKDASKPESEEIPLVNAEEGISKEDESILPAMRAKERCFPRCMSPPLAVRVPLIATVFNSRVPILAASEPKTVAAYPGGFGAFNSQCP